MAEFRQSRTNELHLLGVQSGYVAQLVVIEVTLSAGSVALNPRSSTLPRRLKRMKRRIVPVLAAIGVAMATAAPAVALSTNDAKGCENKKAAQLDPYCDATEEE